MILVHSVVDHCDTLIAQKLHNTLARLPGGLLDDQLLGVLQHSVQLLELQVLGLESHRLVDRSLCRVPLTKYGVAQGQVVIRTCQTGVERHGSCEHLDRRLELASLAAELAKLPQHVCVVWSR